MTVNEEIALLVKEAIHYAVQKGALPELALPEVFVERTPDMIMEITPAT